MPSFFSRRYIRPLAAVGRVERTLSVLILLLMASVVAAFVHQSLTNREYLFELDPALERAAAPTEHDAAAPGDSPTYVAEGDNPFPTLEAAGWSRPAQVARYTPDDLYVKINGRVGLYLQYHVAGLTFGEYSLIGQPDRTIDVFWYDMGGPENALGIYRAESPPDGAAVPIGAGGYETGGAVFFIKGGCYVQVLPTTTEAADAAVAMEIARKIGERIEGGDEGPWALKVLPTAGRADNSLEYVSEDAFGLSFLKEVFTAAYEVNGAQVTMFVHRAVDDAAAAALYDRYLAYFKEDGRVLWSDPDASRRITAGEVYGAIDVVFVKGRYFGGVAGAEDAEIGRQAAAKFHDELAEP